LCYCQTIIGKFGRQIVQVQLELLFFIFLCIIGIGRQICPSAIRIVVCIFLCPPGIGRKICPSATRIVVCIFLDLEDKFVQVQLELLFVSSCVYLELEDKFFQVKLELFFVSSCVFLELEEKFVQVNLELELELFDVSSFVIQKQISPLGCGLLNNTKKKIWWVFGSQFLSLNMGNQRIREINSSRKKKLIEKVEEEREKEKLHMLNRRISKEGNTISREIDVAIVSPPSP
jgi:hypothetical protein